MLKRNEVADHRVRVAGERRDRMRKRLFEAVMAMYARNPHGGPPLVEDVITQADVSKATFYKYFSSVEQVIAELGAVLTAEMVQSLVNIYRGSERPYFRMAVATQLFLLRSVTDRVWAAFVSHTDILASNNVVFQGMRGHVLASRDEEIMDFKNLDAALTLAAGALLEAMRKIVRGGKTPEQSYVEEVMTMILRGLGVEHGLAGQTVRESANFIRETAPALLPWWRDPWA